MAVIIALDELVTKATLFANGRPTANSQEAVRLDLSNFASYVSSTQPNAASVVALTPDVCSAYKAELGGKFKPTTISRRISSLKTFMESLVDEGMLPENPAAILKVPSISDTKHAVPLSVDQVVILLTSALPTVYADGSKDPVGLRNYALLQLVLNTGLGVSEVTELGLIDIIYDRRTIKLQRGKKVYYANLNDGAFQAMADYLKEGRPELAKAHHSSDDKVFVNQRGEPLGRQGIWHIIREVTKEGLHHEVSPEVLRMTAFVQMIRDNPRAGYRELGEMFRVSSQSAVQRIRHAVPYA